MRTVLLCTAAVAAVAVTACSSDSTPGKPPTSVSDTSTPTSTTAAPSTPTTPVSTAPSSGPTLPSESDIAAVLLTPPEVGTGFTAGTYSNDTNPLPCAAAGSPSFDTQAPAAVKNGAEADNSSAQAQFSEEIRVYHDTAEADKAVATAKAGLNCSSGNLYTTDGTPLPVTIDAPVDVSTQLGNNVQATAWQVHSTDIVGTYILAQHEQTLVLMGFAKAASTPDSGLPDPLTVAKAAIDKIASS